MSVGINRIIWHTRGARRSGFSTHIVLLAYGSLTRATAWSSRRTRVECSFFGECALNCSIVSSFYVEPSLILRFFSYSLAWWGPRYPCKLNNQTMLICCYQGCTPVAFHQSHLAYGSPPPWWTFFFAIHTLKRPWCYHYQSLSMRPPVTTSSRKSISSRNSSGSRSSGFYHV